MSEREIPKIKPRVAKVSEEIFERLAANQKTKLEILKRQLSAGKYKPTSTALAHSLVGVK